MQNVYSTDIDNKVLSDRNLFAKMPRQKIQEGEDAGASCIAMCCGSWYHWSLALGEPWFEFTLKEKRVTFFHDGKTRSSTSTWPQCGRALAALFSLPESGASPSVSDWKNQQFYLQSFLSASATCSIAFTVFLETPMMIGKSHTRPHLSGTKGACKSFGLARSEDLRWQCTAGLSPQELMTSARRPQMTCSAYQKRAYTRPRRRRLTWSRAAGIPSHDERRMPLPRDDESITGFSMKEERSDLRIVCVR